MEQITAEQIAAHYSAALDSVAVLQAGKPEEMSDVDWERRKTANIEHIRVMLAKDFWTTEDLTPLQSILFGDL